MQFHRRTNDTPLLAAGFVHFIKYHKILDHCHYKLVCFNSNDLSDIMLLNASRAGYHDKPLLDFVKAFEDIEKF